MFDLYSLYIHEAAILAFDITLIRWYDLIETSSRGGVNRFSEGYLILCFRLQVVPLSLSPSSETRKRLARKNGRARDYS